MSKLKSIEADKNHVIKRGSGWALVKEGADKATKVYTSKEEAVKEATKKAKEGGDLIIHTENGTIEEWKTYKKKE